MSEKQQIAIVIGAGPAGLTAAYELQKHNIKPIIIESSNYIGGISRTVNYKGNRIDIGGHRFFSKSDTVMKWWNEILPIEITKESAPLIKKYGQNNKIIANPNKTDNVMLVRHRLSRIYYGRKFYDYPVQLNKNTIANLGFAKMAKIGISYAAAKIKPRNEENLEGFYINRFGKELYDTFFHSYTEKLWGVAPKNIDSSWGAQRVKGLSVTKVLLNAIKPKKSVDVSQKDVETSLIEFFLYPKLGPGYLWETVAKKIRDNGGEILMNTTVTKINSGKDYNIKSVTIKDNKTNKETMIAGDYCLSTMPVSELIPNLNGIKVPENIKEIAINLPFRDFITVGILAKKLKIANKTNRTTYHNIVPDNWIYIQEPDVRVCRLQVFNNWSPYLVKDKNTVWVGMEYVVSENDDIWKYSDKKMSEFGISELEKMGIIDRKDIVDTDVIHLKKAYPAYFGTYKKFDKIKDYTDKFSNLYLIGRNGQHHYNNQDHSMLTAMEAVNNIVQHKSDKKNIWNVNTEKEYHEVKNN